ncbi:MAG: hypothetical protein RR338_03615 [Clostridia bacterium]
MQEYISKKHSIELKIFINGIPKFENIPTAIIELMASELENQLVEKLKAKTNKAK